MPHRSTPEQIEEYQRMSPGERIALSLKLARQFEERPMKKPQKVIDRYLRMWHYENDMRNKNMLEAFARLKARERPAEEVALTKTFSVEPIGGTNTALRRALQPLAIRKR